MLVAGSKSRGLGLMLLLGHGWPTCVPGMGYSVVCMDPPAGLTLMVLGQCMYSPG